MLHVHKNKNFFLVLIGSVVLILIGFTIFNNYIYQEKQEEPQNIDRYQGTLTGEYVCLPHRDTSGPTTLECAFGLLTDSGEYYAVGMGVDNTGVPEFIAGQRVTLTGVITPVEMLSTDYWQKYIVSGIISVNTHDQESLQKL